MFSVKKTIPSFLADDRGAISVDYVVLAAGATGMALMAAGILTGGMGLLSDDVESELHGEAPVEYSGLKYTSGFDNGADDWTGVGATKVNGIGNVLGPIAGSNGAPSITRVFQIDPAADKATFNFELLAMDSLDHESGIIYIDGREIGRLKRNWSSDVWFIPAAGIDPARYTITQTTLDDDAQIGGSERWLDHRSAISIVVNDPDDEIEFGFGSTANQDVDDESFSIDNFVATGLLDSERA